MSDVSLFLSSYFWGYLETLDLLCGGINLEKLHWMQSLVPAPSSGRANPWCEQGWWWHRGAQQGFLHSIFFFSSLWAALQGWENTSKPGKTHPNLGKGNVSLGWCAGGSPARDKSDLIPASHWGRWDLCTSAHEGLWEIPAMKVNYKPLINQTFTVGWSGLAVWAPSGP